MLSQNATVVDVSPDHLELQPVQAGCNSCSTGKSGGCGVANLSALFGQRESTLKLSNPGGYHQHDEVELLLDESVFMRTVLLQYLLPLITMLLLVVLSNTLFNMLLPDILAAIAGLVVGVQLARFWIKRLHDRLSPENFCIRNLSSHPVGDIQQIRILQS